MAYKKVIFGDEVLIDLTEDTVTPETLMPGTTAHNKIGEIITGTGTSDGTATSEDIAEGKIAYVNGVKVTGTIPKMSEIDHLNIENVENEDFIHAEIPDGFYKDSTAKIHKDNINEVIGLTPEKIIFGETVSNLTGTATSDANATSSDILQGKTAYVNGQLIEGVIPIVQSDEQYYISEKDQIITLIDGYYANDVSISLAPEKIESLLPENIRSGLSVLGVTGSMIEAPDSSEMTATAGDILNGKTAYIAGGLVEGTMPSFPIDDNSNYYILGKEYKYGIPKGYHDGNEEVSINPVLVTDCIEENIRQGASILGIDGTFTSDSNATSGDLLSGKTAYVNGEKVIGSLMEGFPDEVTFSIPLKDEEDNSITDSSGNEISGWAIYLKALGSLSIIS